MSWLDAYVEKEGITKRSVIESALKLYRVQEKKRELAQMFSQLNRDEEVIALAESGLDDYMDQLRNFGR